MNRLDLPHLNSIKLGEYALQGRWDGSYNPLLMESDINMNKLMNRSS